MEKFSRAILNHKKTVISVFIALIILACVGLMFVETNSDVQSYLANDSMTAQGRDELYAKYKIQGESSIVLKGADEEFMRSFVANAQSKKFVTQVSWIGSFDMIKAQLENPNLPEMEREILTKSYAQAREKYISVAKDGSSMHLISFYYSASSTDDIVMKFLKEMDKTLDGGIESGKIAEYAVGGMASNARAMLESSIGEIPIYLVIAVVVLAVILLITTKSWLEPLIFILTLGISMLLNMGSNVIFGAISTITYSASTILQLALAMDYSIFLMHCYYDERTKNPLLDPRSAMAQAMPKTLKSITASAMTTIGGFIALFAMKFRMGIDLGAVLAKGVLLSLLTVIILQPILILLLHKPIAKTQHKYFKPTLKHTQNVAIKGRIPIVVIACLLVIPCLIGQFDVPLSYLTMTKENKQITETEELMAAKTNQIIIVAPKGLDVGKQYDFLESINGIKVVEETLSAYSLIPEDKYNLVAMFRPELLDELGKTFFKGGSTLYIVELNVGIESDECYAALDTMNASAVKIFGEGKVFFTGLGQGAKDLSEVTPTDFIAVSLISALIILLILILTYKEFALSIIMLLVIELGIWINLSIVTLVGIKINFMSYLIISSVQLGATVDYAILVASKYKEAKGDGERDDIAAIKQAVRVASPSILVSASVLISICVAVFFVTSNKIISEITLLIGAGAAMSTFLVMTLLPAILAIKADIHAKRLSKRLKAYGLPAKDTSSPLIETISPTVAIAIPPVKVNKARRKKKLA